MSSKTLFIFTLLISFFTTAEAQYQCPPCGTIVSNSKDLISAGPGCLVTMNFTFNTTCFGNWSWSGGGSSGNLFINGSGQTGTVGPIYVNQNCNSLGSSFLTFTAPGNVTCELIPLPVEFEKITLKETTLSWTTLSEVNLSHYEIEATKDFSDWINVGKVYPLHSATLRKDYVYHLPVSITDGSYIRLKMIDLDGTYTYSKTLALNFEKKDRPLPSTMILNSIDAITLPLDNNYKTFQLYTMHGQLLKSGKVLENQLSFKIDPGQYLLKVGIENSNSETVYLLVY